MRRPLLNQNPAGPMTISVPGQRATDVINRCRHQGTTICILANGKGGSGKSTLTINMAVGYAWQKKRVLVVDADVEQQTVAKWPRPAGLGNPVVVSWPTVEITGKLAQVIEDYDFVLIDLAGRDDRAIASVLSFCDILISPAKPSPQDLSELGRLIQAAKAKGVPHLVLFNEATRETTRELAQLAGKFARFAPFLPTAMQQLTSYRRVYAHGRGVLEIKGADAAKENFARVFKQIAAAVEDARASRRAGA